MVLLQLLIKTVKLDKGLNFTGGNYTTASVGADGKVTFDVTLGTTQQ